MFQARNSALSMDANSVVTPPGCHTCTEEDKRYCVSKGLIEDHCCCDKRYHETLPFIPHTCYLGRTLCKTVVSNCEEYSRLRTCCCQKLALIEWKAKSNAVRVTNEIKMASLIILNYFMYSCFT
ncbi:hypothetical protein JTB14_000742 [Gonioctena quinquepunctata]|nr:hypothetical protein JTB14_000742 [Gonioctena quinquepunctata]